MKREVLHLEKYIQIIEVKAKEILKDFDIDNNPYFEKEEVAKTIKNINDITVWISQEEYILTYHLDEKEKKEGIMDLLFFHIKYHLNLKMGLPIRLKKFQYTTLLKRN
jgi:hypothetical protein